MIEICALASGSNGNCYYIGNGEEAVLIDAGISRRQVLKRMKEVKLDIRKVKAVFITHEHADHIRGLRVLCDMHDMPGYLTESTIGKARKDLHPKKIETFTPGEVVQVGSITVHTFAKQHDAVDPCSFRVEVNGQHIGVMTDIGAACENVKSHLSPCDAVFLESNYDETLLMEGPYPYYLKQRVASDNGHLSNEQARDLVKDLRDSPLKTIFLSHISADNNRPELAMRAFEAVADRYEVLPTSRYAPTAVYRMN